MRKSDTSIYCAGNLEKSITVYHTKDLEKISKFISPIFREISDEAYLRESFLSRLLDCNRTIQSEGSDLQIKLFKICPSSGNEFSCSQEDKTPMKDRTYIKLYQSPREAYVFESNIPEHEKGQHLGVIVTDVYAKYSGSSIRLGSTSRRLNVAEGHFDMVLIGFDKSKPGYKVITNYLKFELGIDPLDVDRNQLNEIRKV
ncbi:hypothetical protein KY342_05870 [Candidatus Woesearchaeota archaeon]|nr:hypothetical protein [Candidatus Woesearchaeota archaeon]